MPLIFGDPKSIEIRDKAIRENTVKYLMGIVKCPLCGAKPHDCFEADIESDSYGFNFDCNKDCPNSYEAAEEWWNEDKSRLYCNSKGKFYK